MKEPIECGIMREFRRKHNLRQEDLAKRVGVSRTAYVPIESRGWAGASPRVAKAVRRFVVDVEGIDPFLGEEEDFLMSPADVYNALKGIVNSVKNMEEPEREMIRPMVEWARQEVIGIIEGRAKK